MCRIAAAFLADGIVLSEPAIAITTPTSRKRMLDHLAALSFDVGRLQRSGNLLLLDAHETLAELMMEGTPDAAGFIDVTSKAVERTDEERVRSE